MKWIFLFLASFASAVETNPNKDPLQRLLEGNRRYVNGITVCHNDWGAKRALSVKGQAPFAVIVCCSDSRVPPEIVFDQSLGDLFVVRIAGNIVGNDAMGSIEYAIQNLGSGFIIVLGHSQCGAVEAALTGKKFDDHIEDIVTAIQPSVKAVKGQPGDPLENATKNNVQRVVKQLKGAKPISRSIEQGKVKIVGGYYRLSSGAVEILQ